MGKERDKHENVIDLNKKRSGDFDDFDEDKFKNTKARGVGDFKKWSLQLGRYVYDFEDEYDNIHTTPIKVIHGSSYSGGSGFSHNSYYDDYDDDYYGYGYKSASRNYGKSYYNSGYGKSYYDDSYSKRWSWSTFTSSLDDEEEDETLMIKMSPGYATPSKSELSRALGLGSNGVRQHRDLIDLTQELCRLFYHKMVDDKDYYADDFKNPRTLSDEKLQMYTHKSEIFNKCWTTEIPGWTPKEKAVYVISEFIAKQGQKTGNISISDLREESIDTMKICMDDFWDPIYNELLDELELKGMGGQKMSILKKVSLIKEFGGRYKIEKEIEEKVVANSLIKSKKIMRDYDQLYSVELYQRKFPNYRQKLATKNLIVNVPIEKTEHKQKIIMLVDYSGSMCETFKQEWVLAVLLERLKYVMREECEIFFSFFLHDRWPLQFTHLHNRETALKFWRSFSTRPTGGDTELGKVVMSIKKEIEDGKSTSKFFNLSDIDFSDGAPEILAINDGQDSVKTNSFVYKTNAINLFQENEEVKNLCKKNKGVHVYIDPSDVLHITE